MKLNLKFDNNGNPFYFTYLSNPNNVLKNNHLKITLDVLDLVFKKHRNFVTYIKNLKNDTILLDENTGSEYFILSHTIDDKTTKIIFEFDLIPNSEYINKSNMYVSQDTYNDCIFSDNSVTNINIDFETYYNQMYYNDAKLLKELIQLLISEKTLEKSKLQKFKDMLINNTDVLGILVPIILKIIGF